MSQSRLKQVFSLLQTIVFKQIGNKIPTNSLKNLMDIAFILFEKIGSKFESISSLYLRLYEDIVLKELSIARLTKDDTVLVIGSGSLPATPVLIAQNTSTKIISIDKDPAAVTAATTYVKNHHLEDKLTIVYADALTYPMERYTVIFVLYGVKHPGEFLTSLALRIHPDTRVIFRTITDAQGKIADKTINLAVHFHVKEHVHTESLGSVDSFLLTKK
jgi:precorrin-6B methylase 2